MSSFDSVAIVGAGPAGAFLSRLLSDAGFEVEVFEVLPKLAAKPCGWAVPYTVESFFRIPGDVVLCEVRGYRVYVEGRVEKEGGGRKYGYIVDKEGLLKHLLEGVTLRRKGVDPARLEGYDVVVDARGHVAYDGVKARVLQVVARGVSGGDGDFIEIFFETDFVGYSWVFPLGGSRVKVGVGGLAGFDSLRARLHSLLRMLGSPQVERVEGGVVASGGLAQRGGVLRVGEALGAVMPLSGEGIRPGMLSSLALFRSLTTGADFSRELERTGLPFNIRVQLAILRKLESLSPRGRAELIRSAPVEILECVTAGCVTPAFMAKAIARWPFFFARLGLPARSPKPRG
uniref:NAD(P)/FAD-dependent oxidoreductase n=1 Tax=Thermofilum pendens TaxID=2269 RepID=A0A7C4F903_THEPE